MSMHAHESDPQSPQELSRRTFMANAVITLGSTIGIGLAIPLLTSLAPAPKELTPRWRPLEPAEAQRLQAATDTPVKIYLNVPAMDAYEPIAAPERFVWAIKTDEATMRAKRPDLFTAGGTVPYPVVNLGFVAFSSICPHLGCPYDWKPEKQRFHCPCHGSEYTQYGEHVAGPAQRGLDPLPLRDHTGTVQITWIEYKQNEPARFVVSYG